MSNLGRENRMKRCSHLHYIKTFKDIHERESLLSDDDDDEAKAVRLCIDVMEEGIVKTESDVWACDDDGDVQTIHNMDDEVGGDDDISILTLKQIKDVCKTRKRKRSQGLDSLNIKIKIDDPSSPEDHMEKQQTEDDPDFMETLSILKTKLSKNMKTKKKKCVKDHPMSSPKIVPVDQSEEILDGQEFSPSSGDSTGLAEVKFDCPESDCFNGQDDCSGRESKEDHSMSSQEAVLVDQSEEILDGQEFSPSSGDSAAPVEVKYDCPENDSFDGPDDCSGIESKEDHSMSSQEAVLVDRSEEILDGQEFSPSSGDSAAPVEVKFDCPENDCFDGPDGCSGRESKEDHPMSPQEIVLVDQSEEILDGQEFSPSSGDSAAPVEVKFDCPENDCSDGPNDYSGRESKEDHPMSSQEIVLVDQSEEVLDGQEFSPSSGDSGAPVEIKFDCPENDCSDGPDDCSGGESKEDHPMSSQEIVLVDESEEILDGHEFPPSSRDSAAVVEVNFERLENDCFNEPDDCSGKESKEDTEITPEWNLQNEFLNNKWIDFFHVPLRMVKPSDKDIVISNSDELSSNQFASFPAIEFEDHNNSDIFDNQLDDDADVPVSPPEVASDKDLDFVGLEVRDDNTLLTDCSEDEYTAVAEILYNSCSTNEHGLNPDGYLVCRSDDSPEYEKQSFASEGDDDIGTLVSPPKVASHDLELRDDNTLLDDCSKDESTDGAEVQDKLCSTTEQGLNPDGCPVRLSDDSPEYDAKQSFVSLYDGERIHVKEATDELTSCDEHEGSSKLHGPERLLSTRKAISPSSQEKLCKAMETIDISHRNNLKCKGKLQFTEPTDKNGDAERPSVVSRTAVTNNPNKNRVIPKTSRSGSNLQGASKIRNSSRSATHLGCSTLQNCSKSAIAFSKQQMHDAESLTMKLTKELNSMKEIMDDMLRSEFCLNTSLRYKVNEARMAVKNATKAEEGAKRWLSFMSRDCNRFCKIMKLADSSSSTPQNVVSPPQDVVRKGKKIAFADEAGGKLCQVRFYEDDEGHLPESK
ncbi:uncharacterized protein [Medicago truncatula]|uniref:uncharacterized protein isoform X2 n=1 Tax=Medicago truncatula TaxID=3880 RepID=UPI000D2F2A62|nr:uncharacterized protein LOC25491513 isoform X2 [Medicago truncatula]